MADLADTIPVGLQFDTSQVREGIGDLAKLNAAAGKTEAAMTDLGASAQKAGQAVAGATIIYNNHNNVVNNYSAATSNAAKALAAHSRAVNDNAKSHGNGAIAALEFGHVVRSLSDELAAGVPITRALTLESGRLFEIISNGGLIQGFTSMASRAAAMFNPITAGAAALTALGAAALYASSSYQAMNEELDRAVMGVGRFSGLSGAGLNAVAVKNAGQVGGLGLGDSRSAAEVFASGGHLDQANIKDALGLVRGYTGAFGGSNIEGAEALDKIFADPVAGADKLNERLGFLQGSTRTYIQTLVDQGAKQSAIHTLIDAVSASLNEQVRPLGMLGQLWKNIGNDSDRFRKTLAEASRAPTDMERYANASRFADLGLGEGIGTDTSNIAETARFRSMQAGGPLMRSQQDDLIANQRSLEQANADRIYEQSRLSIASIMAPTASSRALVDFQRTYNAAIEKTPGGLVAAATAQAKYNEAVAQGARTLEDALRTSQQQNALIGLKPYQRIAVEEQQKADDLRRNIVLPNSGAAAAAGGGTVSPAMLAMAQAFVAAGYDRHAVAGFVGGMSMESGTGLDPMALNGSGHRGMAQWDPTRWSRASGMLGDGLNTQAGQTSFSLAELTSTERRAGGMLAGSDTVLGGLLANDAFERPGAAEAMRRRGMALARGTALDAALSGYPAGASSSPLGASNASASIDGMMSGNISARQGELSASVFRGANEALDQQNAALAIQRRSFGLSSSELATMNERQKLLNDLQNAGVPITGALSKQVDELAARYGDSSAAAEKLRKEQNKVVEALDGLRSGFGSGLTTFITDLEHGTSVGHAFRDVMLGIGQSLQQAGIKSLTNGLLGGQGTAGQDSLFGGFFSHLFGGGGIGSLFGGLFGGGGGLLGHNAAGTDYWRGGPTVVGEKGPEIVNLQRGAQVIPNDRIGGTQVNMPDVQVHIHAYGGAPFTSDQMRDIKGQVGGAIGEYHTKLQREFGTMQANYGKRYG